MNKVRVKFENDDCLFIFSLEFRNLGDNKSPIEMRDASRQRIKQDMLNKCEMNSINNSFVIKFINIF